MKDIIIKNAYLHNLKNIDVSIPKNKLVAITGVSGSGKSSLVFDILYNEGFKGYLNSIGFSEKSSEGDKCFDSIKGLCPVIAVGQRSTAFTNWRSVVGTQTKLYNYLKMLFCAEGKLYCKKCNGISNDNQLCKNCGFQMESYAANKIAKLLSFNSDEGMCRKCYGRGYTNDISLKKVIGNENVSLGDICKPEWVYCDFYEELDGFIQKFKLSLDLPYRCLSEEAKEAFVHGYNISSKDKFKGILNYLQEKVEFGKPGQRMFIFHKMERSKCTSCNGYRLGEEGLRLKINGKHIGELANIPISDLKIFLIDLQKNYNISHYSNEILNTLLSYIQNFESLGLDYLSMFREMPTLSGGETQRLMLISHLFSKLDSVMYIFDEPTAGLHETEKQGLMEKLLELGDTGNSILIVEHDKNVIECADHVIDFGPFAGEKGGNIVYQGDYKGLLNCNKSITGMYFSSNEMFPKKRKETYNIHYSLDQTIKLKNVRTNNLKNVEVNIPLGVMVGVAGVSGSGKSSLISNTLAFKIQDFFFRQNNKEYAYEDDENDDFAETIDVQVEGLELISDYSIISQNPIRRNKKSIPLTFLDIWENVINVFLEQPSAKDKGYTKKNFSFNSEGACINCNGQGQIQEKIKDFEISYICPECSGKRYKDDILQITYQNKNIWDVLEMSVSDGINFFSKEPKIVQVLNMLEDIGMGYLKMGQPVSSLSGGEAQRLKLVKELSKNHKDGCLYILDEPTVGLSLYDTSKLIEMLDKIIKKRNTVVVVEHDLDLLSFCDWIIELGPGGGSNGGRIIAEGSPRDLKENKDSIIGKFLKV